jgi:hypothetical protein
MNNATQVPDTPALAFMDAPTPGSSLTTPPGERPYERPPKYVQEDDALYNMLDKLTTPEIGVGVGKLLSKGVYASDIADSVLMAGVAEGHWTPDLAALMAKKVLGAVVAVGHAQGVENIRYMHPDMDKQEKLEKIARLPSFRGGDN